MKDITTKIEGNKILISLPNDYYEKFAVMSAMHEMTDSFIVLIEPIDDKNTGVYFQTKKNAPIEEDILNKAALDFCNKVLDHQIRLDIEKRYGNLRTMIVKQAFAPISVAQLSREISIEAGPDK
jgi:His-Xaa-Ser system protein HxsD